MGIIKKEHFFTYQIQVLFHDVFTYYYRIPRYVCDVFVILIQIGVIFFINIKQKNEKLYEQSQIGMLTCVHNLTTNRLSLLLLN